MNTPTPLDRGISYSVCTYCRKKTDQSVVYCDHCGFPEHGSSEQKKHFYKLLKAHKKDLDKSRNIIYMIVALLVMIAGFNGYFGVLMLFSGNLAGIFMLLIGSMFGGFAYWSLKKPLTAIITALVIYLLNLIVSGLLIPGDFFDLSFSMLWKVLFLAGLINGILAALKIKKIERAFKTI